MILKLGGEEIQEVDEMAEAENTDVRGILQGIIDGVKAGTVFGEPIEKDGAVVLPVARISGGGGGGQGRDSGEPERNGSGGGLGLMARPVGVYVLRDDKVTWVPAVDVTRIVLGGQLVVAAVLLTIRTVIKVRHMHPHLPRGKRS
jgi:uncharacterized spore protein YtfJ